MKSPLVSRLPGLATAAVFAAAGAAYAAFVAATGFRVGPERYFTLFDDAMISMTYARNLAEGHGLVWNAGEQPVEGYTNFLWTLWMAVLHLAPVSEGTVSLLVMASGALLLLATALVVRAIALRLAPGRPWLAVLAVALVALYYPLAYWTLRGTEVGLLALLTAAAVLLVLRLEERYARSDVGLLVLTLAAGLLTRTDFAVVTAAVVAYVAWRRWRVAAVLAVSALGTLAAHTAFRLAYYGEPLPNTYYLKVEGASLGERLDRGVLALEQTQFVHLYAPTLVAVFGLIALLVVRRVPRAAWLLAGAVSAQAAYSVYVGGDAWEWMQYSNRYLAQVAPLLLLGAALSLPLLARAPRVLLWALAGTFAIVALAGDTYDFPVERLQPFYIGARPSVLLPALLAAAAVLLAVPRVRVGAMLVLAALLLVAPNRDPLDQRATHGAHHVGDDALMTRYGIALREATDARARIAVVWAGAIPYYAHRTSIDLLGKSDPVIARSQPQERMFFPGHTKWNPEWSINTLRPDVVAQVVKPRDVPLVRGYQRIVLKPELGWTVLVRRDSQLVDRDKLRGFIAEVT